MTTSASLTLDCKAQVGKDVLFQELEGEAVLLNLKTGVYFGLDPVGARIWKLLAEHNRLGAIAEVITEEYEVTIEVCANDLLQLMGDLHRNDLVTIVQ